MTTEHIVKSFDDELHSLDNMVAEMGGLAEVQLADAITALTRRDTEMAQRIVARDRKIDVLDAELNTFSIRMLALRQPMAEDLRIVVAALKISASLERVGDYAKNVAKRTVPLSEAPPLSGGVQSISRMAVLVQGMIKNVLDAYVQRDADKAIDVRLRDQDVDQIYNSLFRELLTYMMEDPRNITTATHLLFVAKNVERIGDHITGIAEQVQYMVTGELPEEVRPKGDRTSYAVAEPDAGTPDKT
jgi:phosphate transport system protein